MLNADNKESIHTDKGTVLILILLIITVLTVTIMESMHLMQVETLSSRIYQQSFQSKSLAKSGTAIAKFLLLQDKIDDEEEEESSDHCGEPWGKFPKNEKIPTPELDSGKYNGTITDEQSKFPINHLVTENGEYQKSYKNILFRLLRREPFALEDTQAKKILQGIKDWIDNDNSPTGEFGAEKNYYLSKKTGYSCPNSLITSLSELRLIRGINNKIYNGNKEQAGLKDLLTVYSNGKININTAPKPLLSAMVKPTVNKETAKEFAKKMLDYRRDRTHYDFLSESDWYRNRMAGYNDIQLPGNIVTTKSSYFSVNINGIKGEYSTSRYIILKRKQKDGKIKLKTLFTEVR